MQHNSTLYISPQITRRPNLFVTPPNPQAGSFDVAGSTQSSFYQPKSLISGASNVEAADNDSIHELNSVQLTQAERLRLWRHDALMQHHYQTAEYVGNKVLQLTGEANDAFWLAQVYINMGNNLRAKSLLSQFLDSVSCRYLAALAAVRLENWDDALDLVGESNPYKEETTNSTNSPPTSDGGIRLEASMCFLRGLVYANQNNFEKAKDAYKEALLIDVKCYEAFSELVSHNLMTPQEEWDFVSQLNYRAADDNAELVKLLYTTQLSKYRNPNVCTEAASILDEEYGLKENPDILLAKADLLYIQCKFDECSIICEKIFNKDPFFLKAVPLQLACLFELRARNKLFLRSHQLAEQHPNDPATWLAIGIYYFSIGKIVEARKFFSKTTLLNPNFGQAWIGFAHTFAVEGEHEQAISAYAYAARVFPGTHLPNLFLGMQHLQMGNLQLSEEYLIASYQISSTDPLLLNELGVVSYHRGRLQAAEQYCREALAAAKHLNSDSKTWVSIHTNLGHILRRLGQPHKALECLKEVLRLSDKDDSNVLAAIGLVYLKLKNYVKAINVLHDALAVSPTDPIASDLLKRALEANLSASESFFTDSSRNLELALPNLCSKAEKMLAKKDENIDLEDSDSSSDEQIMDIESE